MKVLIIEDDGDTQEYLKKKLEEKCVVVDTASTGDAGMKMIRNSKYDVVLLDYALPNKDGFVILQEVRSLPIEVKRNTPIIMISVTNELLNKVTALDYGADDYLPKPFFFAELYARIQAVLRRPQLQVTKQLVMGSLVLDTNTQQVTQNGKTMNLTRKEYSLLEYLMKNQGSVLSRNEISESVWSTDINPFSNTVEMHIVKLRKKLEQESSERFIHNIPGRGYSFGPANK